MTITVDVVHGSLQHDAVTDDPHAAAEYLAHLTNRHRAVVGTGTEGRRELIAPLRRALGPDYRVAMRGEFPAWWALDVVRLRPGTQPSHRTLTRTPGIEDWRQMKVGIFPLVVRGHDGDDGRSVWAPGDTNADAKVVEWRRRLDRAIDPDAAVWNRNRIPQRGTLGGRAVDNGFGWNLRIARAGVSPLAPPAGIDHDAFYARLVLEHPELDVLPFHGPATIEMGVRWRDDKLYARQQVRTALVGWPALGNLAERRATPSRKAAA